MTSRAPARKRLVEALEFSAHGHRRVAAMHRLFRRLLPGLRGQVVGPTRPGTSVWIAWMNGALESGERAAAEILAADGRTRAPTH